MENDFLVKSAYPEWADEYNWGNCKIKRESYGGFLYNYLLSKKNGYVLNIDSKWGSGKTEFLKRLYVDFMGKNHPCIYIDAWTTDFSDNPLLVVASELINQLEKINEDVGGELGVVKNALGGFLKGSLIAASGYISKKITDDAGIGMEVAKEFLGGLSNEDYLNKLRDGHKSQKNAIDDIKKSLAALAEVLESNSGANLPVFVFLDELDRCRPNYAVEMLESIKHFFDVPGFVFVVATDTEQISHAIKVIYGDGFSSEIYLRRFFNAKVSLPLPDVKAYTAVKFGDRFSKSVKKQHVYPRNIFSKGNSDVDLEIAGWLGIFAKAYHLQLRDVDQLFERLLACALNFDDSRSSNNDRPLNVVTLLALILESDYGNIDLILSAHSSHNNLKMKSKFLINETTMLDEFVYASISLSVKRKINGTSGKSYYAYPDYNSLESAIDNEMRIGQVQFYNGLFNYAIERHNHQGFDCMEYKSLVDLACNLK